MEMLFLIGFMGAGKSTFGKILADFLGYSFLDFDQLLEQKTGMRIHAYFQAHSEQAFRQLEYEVIQNTPYDELMRNATLPMAAIQGPTKTYEKIIFAMGGGAPCYYDNMDWMNARGLTIYLDISISTLVNRLKTSSENRPLTKNIAPDALTEFVTKKLTEREKFYRQAKHIITEKELINGEWIRYFS